MKRFDYESPSHRKERNLNLLNWKADAQITPQMVDFVVLRIEGIKTDEEHSHNLEDALHFELLRAISEGRCTNSVLASKIAIKTHQIDFPRYTA